MTATSNPLSLEARLRLKEQQRREAEALADVLAAETRLDAQRAKYRNAVARADAELARSQQQRDRVLADLAKVAGNRRAADLLGLVEADVAKLVRASKKDRKTPDAGVTPAV